MCSYNAMPICLMSLLLVSGPGQADPLDHFAPLPLLQPPTPAELFVAGAARQRGEMKLPRVRSRVPGDALLAEPERGVSVKGAELTYLLPMAEYELLPADLLLDGACAIGFNNVLLQADSAFFRPRQQGYATVRQARPVYHY